MILGSYKKSPSEMLGVGWGACVSPAHCMQPCSAFSRYRALYGVRTNTTISGFSLGWGPEKLQDDVRRSRQRDWIELLWKCVQTTRGRGLSEHRPTRQSSGSSLQGQFVPSFGCTLKSFKFKSMF